MGYRKWGEGTQISISGCSFCVKKLVGGREGTGIAGGWEIFPPLISHCPVHLSGIQSEATRKQAFYLRRATDGGEALSETDRLSLAK